MRRSFLALLLAIVSAAASAQANGQAADHDKLRKLKSELEQAVSKRDFEVAKNLFHQPFMATVITQDSFTDLGTMKSYFDGLFSRDFLRMKDMSIKGEADALSSIYSGTFAMTRGSTIERYELADGRTYDMKGRWTAVSIKESDGTWKVLGIHMGTNFLDNPVLNAVERSVLWFGVGGAAAGLLIGFLFGRMFRRRRASA